MKKFIFILVFCLAMLIGTLYASEENVYLKDAKDYELFNHNGKVAILSHVSSDRVVLNELIDNNGLINRYQIFLPIFIQISNEEENISAYLVRNGQEMATEKELAISNLGDRYEVCIEQIVGMPDGIGMNSKTIYQEKKVYNYRINWVERGFTKETTNLDIVIISEKDADEYENIYTNMINKNFANIYSKIMTLTNGELSVLENYLAAKYGVVWDIDTKIIQEMRELNMAKIEFSDLNSSYWAYNVIKSMAAKGILNGYEDGSFKPENNLTRAEAAQIISKFFNLSTLNSMEIVDVPSNHWASIAIKRASIYIPMSDNIFDAESNITRKDFIVAIMNLKNEKDIVKENCFNDLEGFSEDDINKINLAYSLNIVNGYGDGTFRPNEPLTRAEACAILARSK